MGKETEKPTENELIQIRLAKFNKTSGEDEK